MPCLSEHERSGAIGMLQAGVRVCNVARHYNCHPSTILHLRDRYQATGSVKDQPRPGQRRITTYVDCIKGFHSDWLPSVPDEQLDSKGKLFHVCNKRSNYNCF